MVQLEVDEGGQTEQNGRARYTASIEVQATSLAKVKLFSCSVVKLLSVQRYKSW